MPVINARFGIPRPYQEASPSPKYVARVLHRGRPVAPSAPRQPPPLVLNSGWNDAVGRVALLTARSQEPNGTRSANDLSPGSDIRAHRLFDSRPAFGRSSGAGRLRRSPLPSAPHRSNSDIAYTAILSEI